MACQPATTRTQTDADSRPVPMPPAAGTLAKLDAEEQAILTHLLAEPVAYIDHPELHRPGAVFRIFGVKAKASSAHPTRFPALAPVAEGVTSFAGSRMPALTIEQEASLFLRLNLARKQILAQLTKYAGRRLTLGAAQTLIAWSRWERSIRARIVEINMPLVLAMGKRTRLANIDFNEMVSEGNMALLRSVDKFDCGRGFKFSTYACRAILKSFSRVAMRASRYRGTFPVEFDPSIERSDHIETQREHVEAECVGELKDIIQRNAAALTDVERTVIVERFALTPAGAEPPCPKTLEQVGQIIGVTKERVRQIQNKALKKIRNALEESYLAA